MTELAYLSASDLLDGYRARRFSPVEVLEALEHVVAETNPTVNAFTTLCFDRAYPEAQRAESDYSRGRPLGPLAGVPFAAKDLLDSEGVRTTYGSTIFRDHYPESDASSVRRVRQAGGILIGKALTHEFAWGATTVNPHFGPCRNPWHLDRISGGSSGGSAVSLAVGAVPLAIGSDTGGSIRIPSSFCGVVGLKPTYGRVSKSGVFPLAGSLDHVGPMARTARDAALMLSVIAGRDDDDPATSHAPIETELDVSGGISGLRIGVCRSLHLIELAPDIEAVFESSLQVLAGLGATIVELGDFPERDCIYETFGAVQRAEALRAHRRAGLFPSHRDDYGDDVRERLERAESVALEDYLLALENRQRLRFGVSRIFREADLLVMPVSAGSPVPIGAETLIHLGKEIEFRELVMSFCVLHNLTGIPSCTVRAGFCQYGMPVGIQLAGPDWAEARVLQAVEAFFQATSDVQASRPNLPPAQGREVAVSLA